MYVYYMGGGKEIVVYLLLLLPLNENAKWDWNCKGLKFTIKTVKKWRIGDLKFLIKREKEIKK